jgi:hypothetical protein
MQQDELAITPSITDQEKSKLVRKIPAGNVDSEELVVAPPPKTTHGRTIVGAHPTPKLIYRARKRCSAQHKNKQHRISW